MLNSRILASEMTVDQYNKYSDATMDMLLNQIENLLDDLGEPGFEVEYHASELLQCLCIMCTDLLAIEWRVDIDSRGQGNICHQQAASESPNLAFITV